MYIDPTSYATHFIGFLRATVKKENAGRSLQIPPLMMGTSDSSGEALISCP